MRRLAIGDVVMVGERQSPLPLDHLRVWPTGRLGEVVEVLLDEWDDDEYAMPYSVGLGRYIQTFAPGELVRIGRL